MNHMSKQRPSRSTPPPAPVHPAARPTAHPASPWRRRVFKNTYTRDGVLRTVKGWSVKIQHRGVRHTFSLRSARRDDAAAEARALHQTIVGEGWDAALRIHPRQQTGPAAAVSRAHESLPKTDSGYWKLRLLHRQHPGQPQGRAPLGFAARIEHDGSNHYFPLGTLDEEAAARKALEVHRTIVSAGWEEANLRFARELALAVHWAADPLAWTYASILTQPAARPAPVAAGIPAPPMRGAVRPDLRAANRPALNVAIVESERGIHQALAWHWRKSVSSVRCFASGEEAIREVPRQRLHLALVNHTLNDMGGPNCAEQLNRLAPLLPVLIYSAHADSEELFKATPGGASGYILKRTTPEDLLAPMGGLLAVAAISAEQISEHVRSYFQAVTSSLKSGQHMHEMGLLTPREREVLAYLSKGYLDKEIAESLGISAWTVHGHIKNIFQKLDVHSRTAAIVKYLHK